MDSSQIEDKIQNESEQYFDELRTRFAQSALKESIIAFLLSKHHRLLILESADTATTAWQLLQILMEQQYKSSCNVSNDYLGTHNQTTLRWDQLAEVLKSTRNTPKFKNLLVCEFTDSSHLTDTDGSLITTIIQRLEVAIKRKVIFIASKSNLFNKYSRNIKEEYISYYNGPVNKTKSKIDKEGVENLIKAASSGDVRAVRKILDSGVDVNGVGTEGMTALYGAATNNRVDVVSLLLDKRAKDLPKNDKWTPLHIAASNGYTNVVSLLLKKGFNVNTKGWKDCTALHLAAANGKKDVVSILLEYGALHLPDISRDFPLHKATTKGHNDILSLLLDSGADVNEKGCDERTALHLASLHGLAEVVSTLLSHQAYHLSDIEGNKPLHLAAENGHENVISALIKYGIDINKEGWNKRTALHCASKNGHRNVVMTLLRHEAKHLFDIKGNKPINLAAVTGHADVIQVLLENDVDVNTKGWKNRTALHGAALNGYEKVVELLLQYNAKHLKDRDNVTPMHLAAEEGHSNTVKLFLENGVDINTKGWKNRTALHGAALNGYEKVVELLLRYNAEHLPDRDNVTPMHLAAMKGHKNIVTLFLENGVDINIRGQYDRTPLHYAALNGFKDTVTKLIECGADIKLEDNRGNKAYDEAGNRKEIKRLLI